MKKFYNPLLFLAIAFVMIKVFYFALPEYNYISFPFNLIGIIPIFAGIAIMGKTRDIFKMKRTPLNYDKPKTLITSGILARTRIPMYIGMFLALLGLAILIQILRWPCNRPFWRRITSMT